MLCDSLGLPCSLVRGGYSRHWNIVNTSVQTPPSSPTPQPQVVPDSSTLNPQLVPANPAPQGSPTSNVQTVPGSPALNPQSSPAAIMENKPHTLYLVDLMFNPGILLPVHSPQAVQYQHLV